MKQLPKLLICIIGFAILSVPIIACNFNNPSSEVSHDTPGIIGNSLDSSAFLAFEEGVTTKEYVVSAVGECHEYDGSGFIYEVYYTMDGYTIKILYDSENIVERIVVVEGNSAD